MLNRNDLEYYWERVETADSRFKETRNQDSYDVLKEELKAAKLAYDDFVTEGNELDEELQKRLNLIQTH